MPESLTIIDQDKVLIDNFNKWLSGEIKKPKLSDFLESGSNFVGRHEMFGFSLDEIITRMYKERWKENFCVDIRILDYFDLNNKDDLESAYTLHYDGLLKIDDSSFLKIITSRANMNNLKTREILRFYDSDISKIIDVKTFKINTIGDYKLVYKKLTKKLIQQNVDWSNTHLTNYLKKKGIQQKLD